MSEQSKIWTSRQWLDYYTENERREASTPWHAGGELDDAERNAISASIQGFQLGESSEGRHLFQRAKEWSRRHADPDYQEAIRRFIAEEQRHARDLGRFMDLNGIPRAKKVWSDTAFRTLRRAAGLELSIRVLVTAEIIAQVYYAALREATGSQVLRSLCEKILRDEREHVRFQAERLALFACHQGRGARWGGRIAMRGLMAATLLVVWSSHRHAYRAGGYSFRRFASETWAALEKALRLAEPGFYFWS
jgi:bacterioferritin (cytochrome b1)